MEFKNRINLIKNLICELQDSQHWELMKKKNLDWLKIKLYKFAFLKNNLYSKYLLSTDNLFPMIKILVILENLSEHLKQY